MRLTETDLRRVIRRLITEVEVASPVNFTTLPKNELVLVRKDDPLRTVISQELYDMVTQTYKDIGGHHKVKTPEALDANYEYWAVADIDDDPEPDVGLFANPRASGAKMGAAGNDGTKAAKDAYKDYSTYLRKGNSVGGVGNWWGEVGDKPAYAMISRGSPAIEDEAKVRELVGDAFVEWYGTHPDPNAPAVFKQVNGWYSRNVGNLGPKLKVILGSPL